MRLLMMVVALASATPVAARDLAVPADKGWQHQDTGLILTARLAGLPRTGLSDTTQSEHDVMARFEAPDQSVVASVFLFKPAIADVALWFDRGATTLQANEVFRGAAPASAAPIGFAPGGAPVASSLRQVYAGATGPYRSTALAVMPLGEWIVAVRMSAKSLSADELDAALMQLIGAIRWPATTGGVAAGADTGAAPAVVPALAAVPVTACAAPLTFRKVKLLKSNTTDVLIQLIGTHAVRVVWVQPSLQIEKTGHYSVSLADVDGRTLAFPSFNGMPAPEQVWDLVGKGGPSATMNGNVMTIDPKTLR